MIRKLFKWAFRLVVLGVIAVVLLAVGHNTALRLLLESRIKEATGFEATVGRVRMEWMRPVLRVSHVRVFHPDALGGRPVVDISEARVRYDFTDLFSGVFRVRELDAEIEEVRFVRAEAGVSTQTLLAGHRAGASSMGQMLVDPLEYAGVDRFTFSAGRFYYVDRTGGGRSQAIRLDWRQLRAEQLRKPEDWVLLWEVLNKRQPLIPNPNTRAIGVSTNSPPQTLQPAGSTARP
ncbi:MAG: hypothetical protein RI897_1568 [Verrucomicrobiota bacterium]